MRSAACVLELAISAALAAAGSAAASGGASIASAPLARPGVEHTQDTYEFEIGVFPPGTTDKSLSKAASIMTRVVTGRPMTLKAKSSGTYVLAIGPSCYHGEDCPFSFTVTVSRKPA